MNKLSLLIFFVFFPLFALGDGWNESEYQAIEHAIEQPRIADRSVVITKFGAKTTASAVQNQRAIQKAIAFWLVKAVEKWWFQQENGIREHCVYLLESNLL